MERETKGGRIRLAIVAGTDFPEASEILVSFPDRWEYVHQLQRAETPLYIGVMPPEPERPRGDPFCGLLGEINERLMQYPDRI